jgi:hypothetical protein
MNELALSGFTQDTEHMAAVNGRHAARFGRCPGTSVAPASRRYRRLIQPATVRLPSIRTDTRAATPRVRVRFRRVPVQPCMRAMAVIVALEIEELHLQIRGRPEQGAVKIFAPNGANQPFNEGMGRAARTAPS